MPPKKKIRYDDSYLKFGFSVIKAYGEGVPRKISEKNILGRRILRILHMK